jgi:hypothetical protein
VALLGKGAKAGGAMAIVIVLSLIIIITDVVSGGRAGFVIIYGIGAAVGFCTSTLTVILMKRMTPGVRAMNLVITVGALFVGAGILSLDSVTLSLVGKPGVESKGIYLLNYALGYFTAGVSMDTLRVLRLRKRQDSKK